MRLYLIVYPADSLFQFRDILLDNIPSLLNIHTHIAMYQEISQSCNTTPRDLRICIFQCIGYILDRLSYHLKVPDHRILLD